MIELGGKICYLVLFTTKSDITGLLGELHEESVVSLFNVRPGIEDSGEKKLSASGLEARIHAELSSVASDYVKLIKEVVLAGLNVPSKYTIRDLQVLGAIGDSQGRITSSDIFKSTGLDPATVTRSAKTLISAGHVNSIENEKDSRSRYLELTSEGHSLYTAYYEACDTLFSSEDLSISGPSALELERLIAVLKRLKTRIQILRLKNFS